MTFLKLKATNETTIGVLSTLFQLLTGICSHVHQTHNGNAEGNVEFFNINHMLHLLIVARSLCISSFKLMSVVNVSHWLSSSNVM